MRTVITILTLSIIGILAYWGTKKYLVSNRAKKQVERLESFTLQKSIQEGDIIFQTSKSSQSKAIQLATNSKYSHMGIIYEINGKFFVYEAVQPVKLTPLDDWIHRGENQHYVIKRLKEADKLLTKEVVTKMRQTGEQFNGKSYDIFFEWSDDKIYCSELVWKIYKQAANVEIGQLERLSDFDLTNDIVKAKMKERYGDNIPMDEKVISPAAIFESNKLMLIEEH